MRRGLFRRLTKGLAVAAFVGVLGVANLAAPLVHAVGFSGDGSGTGGDPYVVTSCAEFKEVISNPAASYKLSQDLDCSSDGNAIQTGSTVFTGSFDGGNHSITIAINDSSSSNVGLFGTVDGGAVKNLVVAGSVQASNSFFGSYVGALSGWIKTGSAIDNVTVTAALNVPSGSEYDGVGAIAGSMQGTATNVSSSGTITSTVGKVGGLFGNASCATISDSHSSADIVAGSATFVGGLIGFDSCSSPGSTITNVYSTGDVTGFGAVGGLVGDEEGGDIIRSYATGTVTAGSNINSGGITGGLNSGGTISDSYFVGDITGGDNVGGLAGVLGASGSGTIDRSYAAGTVAGNTKVAGLVGWVINGTVTSSFWNSETSGISTGAGTGQTTAAMKDLATYTSLDTSGLTSAWDFAGNPNDDAANDDVWSLLETVNDGYPCLTWDSACAVPTTDSNNSDDAGTAAVPNNGDANGDGTQDSTQSHVAGSINPVTGKYSLVEAGSGCDVASQSVVSAGSVSAQDNGYTYPAGLMNFTVQGCGSPGYTTTVTQYYYGLTGSDYTLRKYDPVTKKYTTINNATVAYVSIGGQDVVKVSYQVTDGGVLDEDGAVNGVIVDPAGLASVVGAPNTGLGKANTAMPLLVAAAGVAILAGAVWLMRKDTSAL